jgi:hypothetical protein
MPPPPNRRTVLSYSDWNDCIGRYCFSPKNAGKPVRFAIDPLVLQRAAAEGPRRHHFTTPEAAADDFRTAVTRHIDQCGWDIGSVARGATPPGLAKLALQVLAVFGIAADDEGGSSYWAALWGVLGRDVGKRGIKPEDLDLETHQQNWAALARWANDVNKGKLGKLPKHDPDAGGRRHVKLPLNHGLLRMEDIQGLYRFFSRINLSPGDEVEPEDLVTDLRYYADDATVFRGAHARRVLQDERLHLAAEQIANAAAQWDGQKIDLAKSRGPVVRLWLSVHTSAETRIRGGLAQLDPNGAGSDVRGVDLVNLLGRGSVRALRTPVVYRPIADRLVVGVRSLLDGRYVESRYVRPGDEGVIARPLAGDGPMFERELRRIARGERVSVYGKETEGLPDGWVVYRLRVREGIQEADIPGALQGRVKIEGVRVRVSGGLRVRGAWMEGAGPTIFLRGGEAAAVIVDGAEYPVSDDCLYPERCPALNELGVHEVWLPGRHRDRVRFRVVVPKPAKFSSAAVEAGWSWQAPPGWPARLDVLKDSPGGSVRGPVIEGEWPPVRAEADFMAAERSAVRLAVALRVPGALDDPAARAALKAANENHPNLLVRQLARALRPHPGAR